MGPKKPYSNLSLFPPTSLRVRGPALLALEADADDFLRGFEAWGRGAEGLRFCGLGF